MPHPKASVLVVDDDETLRETISTILGGLGYQVRTAHDGFSALTELRAGLPDIILSDLNMPGMSGFELLSVVHRRHPQARVIAMSGAHTGEQVPDGVAAEAFYEKGTGLATLLRIVDGMSKGQPRHTVKPIAPREVQKPL